MSKGEDDTIIALHGAQASLPFRQRIAVDVIGSVERFEAGGDTPTGAVWVVFDDKGAFRSGWSAEQSALPSTAIIGMAIAALTRIDQ